MNPVPGQAVTVGVDAGTLSGRTVAVQVADGAEPADAAHPYTHCPAPVKGS